MKLKNSTLLILILLGGFRFSYAQNSYPYQSEFEAAYAAHPDVPKGILEAVSYSQTRFTDLQNSEPSCIGLPVYEGVMGFIADGQGYFRNTKSIVANGSGIQIDQLGTPAIDIMAYAAAYEGLIGVQVFSNTTYEWKWHESLIASLCEIPFDDNPVNEYARSCFTYQVLNFLRDEENQAIYNFPAYEIDLEQVYGANNYLILSSKKVQASDATIMDFQGNQFEQQSRSFDYAPALWVATPTCNYSSRNGTPVSAVTVHTVQGSYAGAISWAQNCSANVSYHYVVRSSDGQITQMVYEADKGWHVGSENPYTIGIEHEGYVDNPAWYTPSMYNASSALVKDITQSGYGINPLRTFQGPATVGINVLGGCTKIKGHQHYPNNSHTDPGINWDWEHYYQLINDNPPITSLTNASGVFYDSGGSTGDYSDDERVLYLIEPANVLSVTINFDQFSIEQNWDYMRVYDGTSLSDPLIGVYTGTAVPTSITSSGGAILDLIVLRKMLVGKFHGPQFLDLDREIMLLQLQLFLLQETGKLWILLQILVIQIILVVLV